MPDTIRPPLTYAAGAGRQRIIVNGQTITLEKAARLNAAEITTVYASGCTGLTALDLPAATTVDARGCTGPAVILGGHDSRGYEFLGMHVCGTWRISAGCRYFTLAKARRHWRNNAECLALVEKIAAEARARGGAVP